MLQSKRGLFALIYFVLEGVYSFLIGVIVFADVKKNFNVLKENHLISLAA
jgi:hypothetical protein